MQPNHTLPNGTQEYLERHGISELLTDVLIPILRIKPEDPVDFMIEALKALQVARKEHPEVSTKQVFIDFSENYSCPSDPFSAPPTMKDSIFSPSSPFATVRSEDTASLGGGGDNDITTYDDEEYDNFDVNATLSPKPQEPSNNISYIRNRRLSVSGESIEPSNEEYSPVVIPKTDSDRYQILNAVSENLMFTNLEPEQRNEIIDAMFMKKVSAGEYVINQGEVGEYFYVVSSGSFDVLVDGEKVLEITVGGSFGELALMYNTPRAASVVATSDSVLWAVDRLTFRRIIVHYAYKKRKSYEGFLKSVPLFAELSDEEIGKIADAIEPKSYQPREIIVEQGRTGESFYIIVEGKAVVSKRLDNGETQEVMTLGVGDYFGEIALLRHAPRAATVIAVGPVKVISLDRGAFIRLLGPLLDVLKRNINNYKQFEELMIENPPHV